MSTTDGPVRIGVIPERDHEVVVVALFGVTVATSRSMLEAYRTDPESFTAHWTEYFTNRLVGVLIEQMQAERGVQGWALATRLAPRAPQLPKEGEEG